MKKNLLLLIFILLITSSCQTDLLQLDSDQQIMDQTTDYSSTRADTYYFQWWDAEWMPTPSGQSRIPSPWTGAGSLIGLGVDILNDRLPENGWVLLFNTFEPDADGPLVNPYFVLYNKYNGLFRIYLYVTSDFVATSRYLQDALNVYPAPGRKTSLLNFQGSAAVDGTATPTSFIQIQPESTDGTPPLAANKWYMLQYEMAYDPNIGDFNHRELQLSCTLSYIDITTFQFTGTQQGTLKGTIGASANNSNSNILSNLSGTGQKMGTAALSWMGSDYLGKFEIKNKPDSVPNNSLGLKNSIFSSLKKGVEGALSSAVGGIPGQIVGLLNATFFGKSGSQPVPVNLSLDTQLEMTGFSANSGSFPSMPLTFNIPGTDLSNAGGYIPLYNKPMGVFCFNAKPDIDVRQSLAYDWEGVSVGQSWTYILSASNSLSRLKQQIQFNPEVLKIADVAVEDAKIIGLSGTNWNHMAQLGYPVEEWGIDIFHIVRGPVTDPETGWGSAPLELYVQFKVVVRPKNGSDPHTIIKSFQLNETRTFYPNVYFGPHRVDRSDAYWYFGVGASSIEHDYGMCSVCGSIYDSSTGGCDNESFITYPPGVSFYWQLSKDKRFACPYCFCPADSFIMPIDWDGPKPTIREW